MNLFWKKLFGGITSTAKLEKDELELAKAMQRYEEVEKSVELAEYKKLYHEVKSADFVSRKKTFQNRKYKDTEEYRDTKKFKKLENSPGIKEYFEVLKSVELERYLAFKATSGFEDLGDPQKVKASEKLKALKEFEHSQAFKNYSRFHDSYIIKEYNELKKLISDPEFRKRDEFWSDPHRWKTTPEYAKEQRFYELKKNPDIEFYNNEKPERFAAYKSTELIFGEEFNWNTLAKSRWNFGFHYKNAKLIGNHSFANELQANNFGQNVSVENGILKIHTRHEKTVATAWDVQKGFVQKEFAYTSDVLQTAEEFRQKGGIFKAKIRCTGNIQHAFWLGTDSLLPHINIFHFDGKQIKVGNAGKNIVDGVSVTGISPSEFYIYTLIWTKNELIWKLNNIELYRTTSNIPTEEMYLVFNSFIPQKIKGDTGTLEVDWVRVYKCL
jgi:hypothetical protein